MIESLLLLKDESLSILKDEILKHKSMSIFYPKLLCEFNRRGVLISFGGGANFLQKNVYLLRVSEYME